MDKKIAERLEAIERELCSTDGMEPVEAESLMTAAVVEELEKEKVELLSLSRR